MRRLILLLAFSLSAIFVFAQNDPHFSLFEYSQLSYNPGYAGSNDAICVSSVHRQDFVGFPEGRPMTTVFNADMPINSINSAVGLNFMQDIIGFQKDFHLNLAYAYRIEIGYGMLGVGVNLGIINRSIDGNWVTPESLEGGTIYSDPGIPHMESKVAFDMGIGAFYRMENFYAGISATHLLQPQINFDIEKPSYIRRHYYITGAYIYQLPNPVFEIKPSTLIQIDGATMQFTFNAQVIYNKKLWGGVSYRFNDAISPMLGMHLMNGLSFGYSYDIDLSPLGKYSSGSHELMVRYCFGLGEQGGPGRYRSVRRL